MNVRLKSAVGQLTMYLILLGIDVSCLQADTAIFTDYFDGTQPKARGIGDEPGCNLGRFSFFDSGVFQVPSSERYELFNAQSFLGRAVNVGVYTGAFDPEDPGQNRLALIDYASGAYGQLDLQSGTDYRLVVQLDCRGDDLSAIYPGPFGVGIAPLASDSSALASGGRLRPLPAFMQGVFSGDEPSVNDGGYNGWYEATGPIRVAQTGLYFINTIHNAHGENYVPLRLRVYDAPFDPNHPSENELSYVPADHPFLRADQDYYFVARLQAENRTGKWMYTMALQRDFFINPGMNGNWWNPQFAGQGFFVDVNRNLGSMFVGWFTFDTDVPANPDEATVGYSGARWLTAYGPYDGASAVLKLELTTGGLLGDAHGTVQDTEYGTLQLDFQDCDHGTVAYEIPAADVAGQMDIVRIAHGNEVLCGRHFVNYPGVLLTD